MSSCLRNLSVKDKLKERSIIQQLHTQINTTIRVAPDILISMIDQRYISELVNIW